MQKYINEQIGEDNYTALHWCLLVGWKPGGFEAVQILVDAGADLDFTDYPKPPRHDLLHLAAKVGMASTVTYLVRKGAPLSDDDNENNILHILAPHRKSEQIDQCVDTLIRAGLDINAPNAKNETPIFLAALNGNVALVNALLQNKCNLNTVAGDMEMSPLLASLIHPNIQIAEHLIKAGCDVNLADVNGFTPLMKAVKISNMNLIQLLLAHGADVNYKTKLGKSACDYCGKKPPKKSSNVRDRRRWTNLRACNRPDRNKELVGKTSSKFDILMVLLEAGGKVEPNSFLLFGAVRHGDIKVVTYLIDHGACVNTVNDDGDTLLMIAAKHRQTKMMKLLIYNGCEMNHQNLQGETALHKVLLSGRANVLTIVKLLLKSGTDVNLRDNTGKTALLLCAKLENLIIDVDSLIRLLIDNGADVHAGDNIGKTALMETVGSNNRQLVEILLDEHADVNQRNREGHTALFYLNTTTLNRRWVNILKLILMNGYDGTTNAHGRYLIPMLTNELLNMEDIDIILYLLIENYQLFPSSEMRSIFITIKETFSDVLMVGKILYENGTSHEIVASLYPTPEDSPKLQQQVDSNATDFREYRKGRNLQCICRRAIRSVIGAGILTKITKLPLPRKLQEFMTLKDVIPEKYFYLNLKDDDDDDDDYGYPNFVYDNFPEYDYDYDAEEYFRI
ncbi:hypothetical protein SNE40_000126 [Patella caerulea]|uniref:SOCS box domain-containing protein n=1 Tax=Patella caerulea TaxID=87958 RepID=A0AAN8Q1U7_PATCE